MSEPTDIDNDEEEFAESTLTQAIGVVEMLSIPWLRRVTSES